MAAHAHTTSTSRLQSCGRPLGPVTLALMAMRDEPQLTPEQERVSAEISAAFDRMLADAEASRAQDLAGCTSRDSFDWMLVQIEAERAAQHKCSSDPAENHAGGRP